MQLFKRTKQVGWAVLLTVLAGAWIVSAQNSGDPLERGFQNPPDSAKPRVWWHWMNGNITQEGIKADLEWMKRVGIAGFQNFDASMNTPQIVEKRLEFMTPAGKDAFRYTGRAVGYGDGHRGLPGVERKRGTLGSAGTGHEEVRVERNAGRGRQSV